MQASIQSSSTHSHPSYTRPSSTSNVIKRDGQYVAYANGIVKDTKTGIEWIVGPDRNTSFDEAPTWVKNLKLDGGGWRMPTVDELAGLYKKGAGSRNMSPLFKTSGWSVWAKYYSDGEFYYFSGGGKSGSSDNRYSRGPTSTRVFAVRSISDK